MKVLSYVSFLDVFEVFIGKYDITVFKRHFVFLSVLPTPRVSLKYAFTLGSISMQFFFQTEDFGVHIAAMKICLFSHETMH